MLAVRTHLANCLAALDELPAVAATIADSWALAAHLSAFVLRFYPPHGDPPIPHAPRPQPSGQPDFWLFLPFATAPDFPRVGREEMRQLALASAYMILNNMFLDAAVDDSGRVKPATLLLAQRTLAMAHQYLYTLFPAPSIFWNCHQSLYDRFLHAVLEERQQHKGRPRPYAYADYARLARGKMAMAMGNPVGLALLDGAPERIDGLLAAWEEINAGVVILDDIKDWQEDYRQGNYTYLLTQALAALGPGNGPPTLDQVAVGVHFSGAMEDLYGRGAAHFGRAAQLARQVNALALAGLAEEREAMFNKFRRQLLRRKLATLGETLSGWSQAGGELSDFVV